MMKALDGLWGLWSRTGGEGNNWRVSVDGKEISPAEVRFLN